VFVLTIRRNRATKGSSAVSLNGAEQRKIMSGSMSALGQKRTFSPSITMSAKCHLRTYRQVRAMSALSLKADIQTPNRMSAKCQKRTWLSGGWRTLVGGADLGFPGNFNITRDPLGRFDRATLNIKGNAQLDYQQIIIQSGCL